MAQVNGRNFLDWDKRFELDVIYAKNITFVGDLKIVLQTVKKFFTHSNIATDTSVSEGNMAKIRAEKLKNINS